MLHDSGPSRAIIQALGPKMAFSILEVCELTSLGRTAIFAEIKAGRLVARKQGRRTLILATDLEGWLRALPAVRRYA
jgi:excisionase family DNA binding protein